MTVSEEFWLFGRKLSSFSQGELNVEHQRAWDCSDTERLRMVRAEIRRRKEERERVRA